jgi:hypothetical protein
MVAMGWESTGTLVSHSSKVTISRLLWLTAQRAYPSMFRASHVPAVSTVPSCMSWSRSGTTKLTVGRRE